ncbi:MAG: urease accessory protein UreE [Chitinophagaceae bacterium]
MLVKQKIGNIHAVHIQNRRIDILLLEWYETNKRILHKRTRDGKDLVLKFLTEDPDLKQDDVIYQDDSCLVMIEIAPCEAIVVRPENMYQMAALCYEIGNKHLPLFIDDEEVLVPYESPLFNLLLASGFQPVKDARKLLHPVSSSVSPHGHDTSTSLFTRILQLTNTPRHV